MTNNARRGDVFLAKPLPLNKLQYNSDMPRLESTL